MANTFDLIMAKELNFTFTRTSSVSWNVSFRNDVKDYRKIGTIEMTDGVQTFIAGTDYPEAELIPAVNEDFNMYINKSVDYILDNPISDVSMLYGDLNKSKADSLKADYQRLIAAIYHMCCYGCKELSEIKVEDKERANKLTKRCLDWLDSTDFYIAPGSTVYHDAEPCGLLRHSLRVINKMTELIKIPTFSAINPCDAYLTAMVHDWCKINFYEQYMRNVKNEETGVWEKVPSYRCNGSNLPFGHGVTSMFMAQKFFKLTTEQALAIRWHMSRWNCSDKELVDLCNAEETYPMIHLLQFADQLAAAKY